MFFKSVIVLVLMAVSVSGIYGAESSICENANPYDGEGGDFPRWLIIAMASLKNLTCEENGDSNLTERYQQSFKDWGTLVAFGDLDGDCVHDLIKKREWGDKNIVQFAFMQDEDGHLKCVIPLESSYSYEVSTYK